MVTVTEAILLGFYMFNLGVMYADEKQLKIKAAQDKLKEQTKIANNIKFKETNDGWIIPCVHCSNPVDSPMSSNTEVQEEIKFKFTKEGEIN